MAMALFGNLSLNVLINMVVTQHLACIGRMTPLYFADSLHFFYCGPFSYGNTHTRRKRPVVAAAVLSVGPNVARKVVADADVISVTGVIAYCPRIIFII